tara:strand:- start:403 stop:786 length:384 start_codon:yes stop_codon:yes gene_type:complete
MYETYNFLTKLNSEKISSVALKDCYKKILIIFSPIIPHFTSECLDQIGLDSSLKWPDYNKKLLVNETCKIVIQINGKKRELVEVKNDISQEDLVEIIFKNVNLKKYIENKEIKKKIFVPNRLINIII